MNHRYRLPIYALLIALLMACQTQEDQPKTKVYFDLNGFLQQQSEQLSKSNPKVTKQLTANQKSETTTIDSLNWTKELEIFQQADLNKPSYQLSYDVTKLGTLVMLYQLKPSEHLAVKELKIELDSVRNLPKTIEAVVSEDNLLFSSQKKLNIICQATADGRWCIKKYSVLGSQKLILTDLKNYSVVATVL